MQTREWEGLKLQGEDDGLKKKRKNQVTRFFEIFFSKLPALVISHVLLVV